ncbi:hypothetical protein ABH899_002437 [Paenibacillus sp. RC84]
MRRRRFIQVKLNGAGSTRLTGERASSDYG